MPELKAGYRTDTGRVRVVNQDNYIAHGSLFAVADGMGGHAGGEVASRLAVEAVRGATLATVQDLVTSVRSANAEIYRQSVSAPELHGMGTTFCGLALLRDGDHEEMVVVNVGDSRVYVLQDAKLLQITRDHSFVEDLVAAGEITHEQARTHPRRHIVTRVLGIEPDVEVDTWEVTPYPGDRYLLCSDGLTGEVDDDEIASVLRSVREPQACADELLERALVSGARDNVTVLVVDVMAEDPLVVSRLEPELGGWLDAEEPPRSVVPLVGDVHLDDEVANDADRGFAAPVAGTEFDGGELGNSDFGPESDHQPVRLTVGDGSTRTRRRLVTWRSVTFVALVVLTAVVALSAITIYARAGYTVTIVDDEVVVQKGRPGGLLWFDPTLEELTGHNAAEFPAGDLERVRAGRHFGKLEEARIYVATKVAEKVEQEGPSGPLTTTTAATTTTTTTTTSPTTTAIAPVSSPVAQTPANSATPASSASVP